MSSFWNGSVSTSTRANRPIDARSWTCIYFSKKSLDSDIDQYHWQSFLRFWDCCKSEAWLKLNDFEHKPSILSEEFSTEILVEEIKLVLTFKHDREKGHEPKGRSYFEIFALSEPWTWKQKDISSRNTPQQVFRFPLRPWWN